LISMVAASMSQILDMLIDVESLLAKSRLWKGLRFSLHLFQNIYYMGAMIVFTTVRSETGRCTFDFIHTSI
jgi:hypothetical protein